MATHDDEMVDLNVKFTSADKSAGSLKVSMSSTVGHVKTMIREQLGVEPRRLIYIGKMLNNDEQTLSECRFVAGHTIVVQAQPVSSATAPVPGSASSNASVSAPVPAPTPTGGIPMLSNDSPAAQALAHALVGQLGGSSSGTATIATNPAAAAVGTVRSQPTEVARSCFGTLLKVIDNILQHPMEDKYRKIKRSNAGFRKKVGAVPGGDACMRALGFVESNTEEGECWIMTPSADAWNVLTSAKIHIQSTMNALPPPPVAGTASAGGGTRSSSATTPGFSAGLGELPGAGFGGVGGGAGMGVGGAGGGMPDMAAMQRMMNDPAAMQRMMNDPSVQAMARANPQMASAMQAMSANPGLMQQAMNAFQNNPGMIEQAQQRMQNQGGRGMGRGGMGFSPPAPAPAPTPLGGGLGGGGMPSAQQGVPSSGGGSGDATEDDLIAEAIMRSLQER